MKGSLRKKDGAGRNIGFRVSVDTLAACIGMTHKTMYLARGSSALILLDLLAK
jgi:hypothetical protein